MKPVRRYNVFYTDAYLSLDYAKHTGILHTKDKQNLLVNRETIPVDTHNALEKELEDFRSEYWNYYRKFQSHRRIKAGRK